MGQTIKVRCNGPIKHVNQVDLDDALREDSIARQGDLTSSSQPERIVLRCRECNNGRVIVTRELIERVRQ